MLSFTLISVIQKLFSIKFVLIYVALILFPIPSFHGELISNNKVTVSNPKKIMIHIRIASPKLLFSSLLCEAITMVCA